MGTQQDRQTRSRCSLEEKEISNKLTSEHRASEGAERAGPGAQAATLGLGECSLGWGERSRVEKVGDEGKGPARGKDGREATWSFRAAAASQKPTGMDLPSPVQTQAPACTAGCAASGSQAGLGELAAQNLSSCLFHGLRVRCCIVGPFHTTVFNSLIELQFTCQTLSSAM